MRVSFGDRGAGPRRSLSMRCARDRFGMHAAQRTVGVGVGDGSTRVGKRGQGEWEWAAVVWGGAPGDQREGPESTERQNDFVGGNILVVLRICLLLSHLRLTINFFGQASESEGKR